MTGPVAIVGMSFRLPGASDEASLWSLLAERRTALSPVPADRWDSAAFHDKSHATPNRTVMAQGGFLAHVDRFDAGFFGISAREAKAMDPQQRMLLEETWRCLENAGVRACDLEGAKVGVYAGIMATDYQQNAAAPGQAVGGFSALGTYGALLANRLSSAFQWTGPSFTVDAACASSLIALHEARRALAAGECDYALVAAANALINPWRSISFSQARMLSPDGECRTFDARANGYVQGEGAVAMLLVRRDDVAALGLRERAAVLGTAVNHVGPSRGVTAPSVASQRAVIEAAIEDAAIERDTVGYVEAHGTGTPLGDPIEAAALSAVFAPAGEARRGVGSIKSNIGHLEAAAGLAGLAKLVLMLERGTVLPTALLEEINPLIDMENGRVRPVVAVEPWPKGRPRAGLSSFGFGGANGHAIVEGPVVVKALARKASRRKVAMPYLLSAASAAALDRLCGAHRALAAAPEGLDLVDAAQTLAQRRSPLAVRRGAVVRDWDEVARALTKPAAPQSDQEWMLRVGPIEGLEGRVWDRLTRDLPALSARGELAEADARRDGARRSPRLLHLARLHALTTFLLEAGLAPDVLYGEGLGRWATLTAAGVLDLADAVAATGEGKRPEVRPRRPSVGVYDPVLEAVIAPYRVDGTYLERLTAGLGGALGTLGELLDQARRLMEANHTYRGFLEPWLAPLAGVGAGAPEEWTAPPRDPTAARSVLLALATARRQTCARWKIPEAGAALPAEADELVGLIALGALAPSDALALVTATETAARIAVRVDTAPLTHLAVAGRLPLLARAWENIAEIENPEAWLNGRAGRPRKPDPLGIDRSVDLGALATVAEGEASVLPGDAGFAEGLMEVLIERWEVGAAVDWSVFVQPHRIADLPAYPFEPERHWLALPDAAGEAGAPQAAAAAPSPSPTVSAVLRQDRDPPAPIFALAWSPLAAATSPPGPVVLLSGGSDAALALSKDLSGEMPALIEGADDIDGPRIARDLLTGPLAGHAKATVVVAWPLESVTADPTSVARWLALPVLRLAAGLAKGEGMVRLVLIGPDFSDGEGEPLLTPGFAAALAAAQSVEAENRVSLEVQGVIVEPGARGVAQVLALDPLPALGAVAVRRDGLLARHLAPVEADPVDHVEDARAWLLLGGFGGIGEALIHHVAATRPNRIAVIGRRPPVDVDGIRDRLAADGIDVAYATADVTDRVALERALVEIEGAVGPVGTVVHGEMVLADTPAPAMSDEAFLDAFAPKALGYANVTSLYRDSPEPPRRIVFGSILGLTGNAGQANYAAGTAHQMAQALLELSDGADVRHLSWGYWGEVGRVANSRHRARVARVGLEAMSTGSGLGALDAALAGGPGAHVIAALSPARRQELCALPDPAAATASPTDGLAEIDDLAMLAVRAAFGEAGWLEPGAAPPIADGQRPLFEALSGFLDARGWNTADPQAGDRAAALAADLRARRPGLAGIVDLVVAASDGVVAVLRGDVPGTQVVFPGGEMSLVEGYYHGNPLADAANARVAERVAERVTALLADPARGGPVRILEVGAGTGGTTAPVLVALDPAAAGGRVEYLFSDLSPAFLRRAKRRFAEGRPWFSAAKYDFDADPAGFDELGQFDVVIAANAVHVTETVADTLERLSARIAPGGALVLNELMRPLEHMTIVFGLLPGWWLAGDARAGAGPLLSPEQWRAALDPLFDDLALDGPGDRDGLVQGVLVAERRSALAEVPAPVDSGRAAAVTARIMELIAETLEIDPDRLDAEAEFEDLGLDSILSFDLAEKIDMETGIDLDPATIDGLATPAALAAEVVARIGNDVPAPASEVSEPPAAQAEEPALRTAPAAGPVSAVALEDLPDDAIAIIGVAGTFPGAESLAALERLIADGAPALGPVPEGRWGEADIAVADADAVRALRGAFLAHGESFDAGRFGLSDREAQVVDPRQRLLLEQSLAALADAGRPDLGMQRETFGVFVGTGGGDYAQKLATAGHPVQPQSLAALMPSSSAARIAHVFGFEGPAMAVDLACASGLAALHLAVNALRRGECKAALVGAASLQATPGFALQIDRAGLLSHSGTPRPFQDDSDGIVVGEGAVALVLKPLAEAVRDGDRIRSVIRGTALAQSGGSGTLTAPSAKVQRRVMDRALADADIDVADVVAVEAHGVGSAAGDRTETEALAALFPEGGPVIAVDTVKPVLGHGLEVSGLSALVVAMQGLARPNGLPRLPSDARFPGSGLRAGGGVVRPAGPVLVNGFSMNGACAAAVIEPAPVLAVPLRPIPPRPVPHEVVLSSALRADIDDRLAALRAWMRDQKATVEETAAVLAGEPRRRCRVVLRAPDTATLERAIDAALAGGETGPDHRFETGVVDDAAVTGPYALPARPIGYPFARRRYWPDAHGAVVYQSISAAEPDMLEDGSPLAIVAACLGLAEGRMDADAQAIDLGVDSIMAIEIRSRLAAEAGLAVEIAELLGPRPIGLVLADARPVEAGAVLVPDLQNRHAPFPLTDLQLAYLVGRSPSVPLGGTGCHVYWEFLCDCPVEPARLERAWNRLVATHDMLRAVFTEDGEQRVLAEVPAVRIDHHDWRGTPDAEAALETVRERMAHEVFEPTRWPLFRIETSEGPRGARIHLSIDLMIIDVLSLFGLLRQWGRLYDAPDATVSEPGVSFRDYIAAFGRLRDGAERARALAFWQRAFEDGSRGPDLPRARPDAELTGARFTRRRTELSAAAWSRFQSRARAAGSTPVAALVAALGATLGRWSGAPEFCLNLTVYDRRPVHPDIDRVIGDFTSTILLPAGADTGEGFADKAAGVSRAVAERLDHTLVSGAEAVRRFGDRDGRAAGALAYVFTSMLGYDAVIGRQDRITTLGRLDWGVTQTPQVLLDAQVFEEEGRLVATWDSVDAAFPDGLIDCAFAAFAATLEGLADEEADWTASATAAIAEREDEERAAVNATDGPMPDDLLHEPLLRQALAEPERIAILAPGESWSFGDLAARALAVAAALPEMPADTLVGIALEKSPWQIAATLGTLIAGGAYLPLDPMLPPDRFTRLARKGEVGVVLTSQALSDRIPVLDGVRVIAVDALAPAPLPDRLPARRRGPDDLAYVLFTSGSTGEPKGVMIEHRAALNTVLDCNDRFAVTAGDRVFGLSALGFDLSVYDIFGPPAAGGTLVLPAPGSLRDPEALAERVRDCGVTLWNSVPMLLNMVVESAPAPETLASLRLAMLSGDWIPLTLPPSLATLAPQMSLVSLGGATEASIWSICHAVGALDPAWRSVPYGRPMRNQRFHVLDNALAACPPGIEGDLYISGAGLARGYWRDAERTDAAFATHPVTGERLYRTGDFGRWRTGGLIEFLGRKDGQVKIGGFRIELGEVESVAAAHPDVRLAVALTESASDGRDGRRRLILYAVPESGRPLDEEGLRRHLASLLPEYMVPRALRIVERLPLTDNGKVDRKALLADGADAAPPLTAPGDPAAPGYSREELVERIAWIVAEVVGIAVVAPEASFFDLGADSLAAVAVNRRLRSELGLKTRVTDLFEHPSVALLAARLAEDTPARNPAAPTIGEPDQTVGAETADSEPPSRRRAGRRRAFRGSFAAGKGRRAG